MADQTITCSSSCTVTLQVEVITPFFQLDLEGGAQIALAIIAVWAVGWAFRTLIQQIRNDRFDNQESS